MMPANSPLVRKGTEPAAEVGRGERHPPTYPPTHAPTCAHPPTHAHPTQHPAWVIGAAGGTARVLGLGDRLPRPAVTLSDARRSAPAVARPQPGQLARQPTRSFGSQASRGGQGYPPPRLPAPQGWRYAVSPSLEAAPEPQPGVSAQRDVEPQRQRTL